MNKTFILAKILLKNGSDTGTSKGGRKKLRKSVLITVIIILAFLPMISGIFSMTAAAYSALKTINQQGVIIALALFIAVITIFFFGIIYTINTFYFSRDIENLLPLPLRPEQILSAKFAVVLAYEYITEAFILVPVIAAYGYKSGGQAIFYLYSLIVFLTLPVIPLAAASAIVMVIMRFTNIAKNKDLFRIMGGVFAMAIALGANIYMQRFTVTMNNPEKIMEVLKQGNNSLIGTISSLLPATKTAVYALVDSSMLAGALYLISFLGITALCYGVFIILGKLLYFKGVIGVSETASKRRNLGVREFNEKTKNRPAVYSYMVKELKLLFRSPVYFLNCILMNFLWPVFLILPAIAQPKNTEGLRTLLPYIKGSSAEPMVAASAFAAAIFITASNMITSTAISREGQNIFFIKYIPVDYKTQLMGKAFSGALMGLAGMAVVVPVAIIMLGLNPGLVLLCLAVSTPGIMFSALAGIIIDVSMPKLNWDTEQKAVKQNLNGILALFGSFAVGAAIVLLVRYIHPGIFTLAIELVAIFGIIDLTLYKIIAGYCVRKLREMDV